MNRRQSGYSLVELLVVVAIVGVISLVSVPNFMAMQRASKLKSSLRAFTSDVRGMRQRAVTTHRSTKLSFTTGTASTGRRYTISEWDPTAAPGAEWKQIGPPRELEESCYIVGQTNFPDRDGDTTTRDIVFRNDGTPLFDAGVFRGTVLIKTDWKIAIPQYTVSLELSGAVKTS